MYCFASATAAFKLFITLNQSTPCPWDVFALGSQIYRFYCCEKSMTLAYPGTQRPFTKQKQNVRNIGFHFF